MNPMKQYLTYSRESGFNIIEATSEEDISNDEVMLLDILSEIDSEIVNRIKTLLGDDA